MKFLTYLLFFLVSISTDLSARESISIVGSSTVYPFSTTVAEEFGRRNDSFKSLKLFISKSSGIFKLMLLK